MPIIQQDPGGDFLNAFLAAFGVSNQAQQQREQTKVEQQRQAEQAALDQASIASTYAGIGRDPSGAPLPAGNYKPIPQPGKGQAPQDYYESAFRTAMDNASIAHANNNAPDEAFWNQQANSYSIQGNRYVGEQYTTQGKLPEAQATTAEIKAKTYQIQHKFEQDIYLLKMRGASQEQIAKIHAAYRRAGGGSSSTSAQAQRAMIAAMNEAERQHVQTENTEMLRDYYRQQALHDADPENNPAPGQPNLRTPQVITVNAQGQPIVVNMPTTAPAAPNPQQPTTKATPPSSTVWKGFGPGPNTGAPTGAGASGAHRTGRTASAPGKPTLYEYSDGSWRPQ